jgi:protein involved in polysaccharide export with SLBB domain
VVANAYADKRVIANAQVTVSVTENRSNAFSIYGPGVKHAGRYPIPGPNYRLSEAVAIAGVADKASTVNLFRLLHRTGKERRAIEVPVVALLAGDKGVDVVIRPGDTIVVGGSPQKFVRVVVGKDAITLDGKAVDAAGIDRALGAIPEADRPRTTVEVAAATDDVPVGRFMQIFAACVNRAKEFGMPPVSNVGVEPKRPATAATKPKYEAREYYIDGSIRRPGVYALGGQDITLAQAIAAAGMPTGEGAFVTVIRRDGDRRAAAAENVAVRDLLEKRAGTLTLQPYDLVWVSAEKRPPFGRAVEIRPAPHAGEIGEVFVGGHVRRPGVCSVSGRKMTAGLILVAAGGVDNETADEIVITRREQPDRETQVRVSLRKILDGTEPDLYLQPGDIVTFGVPTSAPGATGK